MKTPFPEYMLVCLVFYASAVQTTVASEYGIDLPFETNEPVVAWTEVAVGCVDTTQRVVLLKAIWADGRVLEKKNDESSATLSKCVASTKVDELLRDIEKIGFFDTNRLLRTSYSGFDAWRWVIEIKSGGKRRRLDSWHNICEGGGGVIVVDGCVKTRPLIRWGRAYRNSPEYKAFLEVWERTLARIKAF